MTSNPNSAPRNLRDPFVLALKRLQSGDPLGARATLEQIVSVQPRHFEALHYLGITYAMGGNLKAAEELIRKAISIKPDYAEALHNLGNVLQSLRRHDAAIECFGEAIKLRPEFPDAYLSLALALEDLDRLAEALSNYDRAIGLKPDFAQAYTNRGVIEAKLNRLSDALASHDRAIALKPDSADAHAHRGDVLRSLNRLEEALASYAAAIALRPDVAEEYGNRGNVLEQLGRCEAALVDYDRAVALKPDFAEAWFNRGNVLEKLQRHADALASYDRVIALEPDHASAYLHCGNVLEKLHRFEEALASHDQALALKPNLAQAHSNRGNVLEKLNRLEEALASRDKAIELRPDFAEAHYNRAHTLYEMDRIAEALDGYRATLRLDPDFVQAQDNLFWHHLRASEDLELIERLCVETSDLKLRRNSDDPWPKNTISNFRAMHDLEQTGYLIALGHEHEGLRRAHLRLQDIRARHLDDQGRSGDIRIIPLSEAESRDIDVFKKSLWRYQVPASIECCLNPENDWQAVEARYFSSYPEMLYIDNLLSRQALEELRKFCLVSTVWKKEYVNQYLGAFASTGFVSPLHVRIATELKHKMPRIFGPHKLEQLWAYKYNPKGRKGINVHADSARVNLNFWITPDQANLNPDSGGLIVYDAPSPPAWGFDEYNTNENRIYDFLEKNRSGRMKVPYRCNRAVLFNSALFHETDEIHFREGYENRRINITYLFGRGLKTY